jgi:hypothetical protein
MTVAYDIIDAAMDKLVELVTADMQTAIDEDDSLRLKLVSKAPFQDDPTTRAPFIIVGYNDDQGSELDPFHDPEVGGGVRWMHPFVLWGGTPRKSSRTLCYAAINSLKRRAIRVLYDHENLDDLASGSGEYLDVGTWDMIDLATSRIFGGESEWYGEMRIEFHLFSVDPLTD